MVLFSTTSAQHLVQRCSLPLGNMTVSRFDDGELLVCIDQDVRDQEVFVLASLQPPAENVLELLFLLDALQRAGATINVIITYFSYARQINPGFGQSWGAKVISSLFLPFGIKNFMILQAHDKRLHELLLYQDVHLADFFCTIAQEYDALVAPDKGALSWVQSIAKQCNKEIIALTKKRTNGKIEIVTMEGMAQGKRLLIVDDIIATGQTMIQAADFLKIAGATYIGAAAVHGVFTPGSVECIEQSAIDSLTVTNSIRQPMRGGKVRVEDISEFINIIVQSYTRKLVKNFRRNL